MVKIASRLIFAVIMVLTVLAYGVPCYASEVILPTIESTYVVELAPFVMPTIAPVTIDAQIGSYDAKLEPFEMPTIDPVTIDAQIGSGNAKLEPFEMPTIAPVTIDAQISSDWAKNDLSKAIELHLMPVSLEGLDLTQPITRAEFAAVSVNVYEALAGTVAIPIINNPFTDTGDEAVLRAYFLGITTGTSDTTFEPDALLNREQAATMLTRVYKKVSIPSWSIKADNTPLVYDPTTVFADNADISEWARDSVYFMVANGIIQGTGNNMFSPKAITPEQQALNYAAATREQALIIAVRMVENLR